MRMITKQDNYYALQAVINQDLTPSAPPSYSQAISENADHHIATNQSLYPVPPQFPPQVIISSSVPGPERTNADTIIVPLTVGPNSARVQCPGCHNSVKTQIKSVSQKSAHIACFILCLLGCCLCSCIPHCMKSFQNVHHYCPECKTFIGTYKS